MSFHVWMLEPTGMDQWDPRVKRWAGHRVRKVQPQGCPKNGTMGHCYVEDAETGFFIGLVLERSLCEGR